MCLSLCNVLTAFKFVSCRLVLDGRYTYYREQGIARLRCVMAMRCEGSKIVGFLSTALEQATASQPASQSH